MELNQRQNPAHSLTPGYGSAFEFGAASGSELHAAYHLAWETYGKELNYFDPAKYPDKTYSDKYDKHSVVFVCRHNGEVVGTLRLILNSELGFYIERDYPIEDPGIPRDLIGELSRFAIRKSHRAYIRIITLGLMKEAARFSRFRRIVLWYALIGEKLMTSLSAAGFNLNPVTYGELTAEQLTERESLKNYYQEVKPLPYLIPVESRS